MPPGLSPGFPYYTPPAGQFGNQSAPLTQHIWEQNPDVGYYAYGRSLGIPDNNSAFSNWFAKQFGKFNQGYNAYTAMNPIEANIVDYANSLGGYDAWQRQFMNQDPRLRGLDPGARGGGPSRWISR